MLAARIRAGKRDQRQGPQKDGPRPITPYNALIVGAPRSGTSLTAQVFARSRYFVAPDAGRDLRHADRHNPSGYFEAESLIEANAGILRRAGFPHHNTWTFESISEEAAAAIPELPALDCDRALVAEFDSHAPWMWKDPRLCYTLGYWWPLVDSETTRVLLIERDPEAVRRSFRRVGYNDSLTRNDALTRVRNHQYQARKEIARLKIPHLQIRFEDCLSSPGNVASRLGDFFGLELTADDLNVRPSLDHSTARGQLGTVALGAARRVKRVLSRG